MDQTPNSPAPAQAGPKKILLVEDDQNLAEVYIMRLEADGYIIKHETDGEKALKTVMSFRPDLILLDVMMPNLNGFEVLDILRNTPQVDKTKVVMLSALGAAEDQHKAKELGANGYLVKSQVLIDDVADQVKSQLASA